MMMMIGERHVSASSQKCSPLLSLHDGSTFGAGGLGVRPGERGLSTWMPPAPCSACLACSLCHLQRRKQSMAGSLGTHSPAAPPVDPPCKSQLCHAAPALACTNRARRRFRFLGPAPTLRGTVTRSHPQPFQPPPPGCPRLAQPLWKRLPASSSRGRPRRPFLPSPQTRQTPIDRRRTFLAGL